MAIAAAVTLSGCAVAEVELTEPNISEEVAETQSNENNTAQTQSNEELTEEFLVTETEEGQEDTEKFSVTETEEEQAEAEEAEESAATGAKEDEEDEEDEEQTAAAYASYIKVTGTGVNIREGAGTGYSSLGTAEQNTLYANLGQSGGWYKTLYQNQTAYISAKYCEVAEIEASRNEEVESVIAEGLKLMGVEYVYGAVRYHDGTGKLYGGFTVTEFDCSSLTQYIFYKGAGVLLQVNTRTQIYQGEHVEKTDLQRGDLMFFTNDSRYNNTGIERVGHVALYLGDNYILHTSSDYAKIEQLTAKRWNYFLEARRMV